MALRNERRQSAARDAHAPGVNNSKDIVVSGAAIPPGVFSLDVPLMSWLGLGLMWIAGAWFLARMPLLPRGIE